MQTPDSLNQVAEFHKTFEHPNLPSPAIPQKSRCDLRAALLKEELSEFVQAIEAGDIVEVADALCDLQYVLAGAVLEFGLGEKFKALFEEVQRSNMSKACNSIEEAQATIEKYQAENNVKCYAAQKLDKWFVYRESDNKTIKSINYSPADLRAILNT